MTDLDDLLYKLSVAQKFLELVKKQAKCGPARIVFPETEDERTLHAVVRMAKEGLAKPILLGKPAELKKNFQKIGLSQNLDVYENAIDFKRATKHREVFAKDFFEMRKEKGMTLPVAREFMKNGDYFGIMMVKMGEADGLISGANSPTAALLHPALQIIRTKERFHKVSGFFFMVLENRLMLFADCAVNIEPNSHELAEIAIDTAETAKRFGLEPRIAMLSFSTNGSGKHPNVERVREATQMVRTWRPDLICEGEMQVDAALSPEVCARKMPKSRVPGNANILIFPNLDAANISYKLAERLGHAHAIGPILQGLQKPINDLSRGCSVEDIVYLAAITSVEAQDATIETCGITALR
ncbi:phosphate acetyltransferase [Candidatus Peregrinibacteria bacterium]|nr:phosphate acetyltransferase [Candidatus Peregrinibacteria bacterium]